MKIPSPLVSLLPVAVLVVLLSLRFACWGLTRWAEVARFVCC